MAENTTLKQNLATLSTTNKSLLFDLNDAKDVIKETRSVIKREQQEVESATRNFQEAEKSYKARLDQVSRHTT
jgi:predicted  nucleic acid-binding Zn-ribbon protein